MKVKRRAAGAEAKKVDDAWEGTPLKSLFDHGFKLGNLPSGTTPNSDFAPARDHFFYLWKRFERTGEKKEIVEAARLNYEKYALRVKGVLDLRSIGNGMWIGNERISEEEALEYLKEDSGMAKVKRDTPVKGATATAPKTSKKAAADGDATVGRPIGRTTGEGVHGAWVSVFKRNEKLPKGKKLTDPQITEFMMSEFPGRASKVFEYVHGVRNKYNKGGLTQGKVPPVEEQSHRYDERGNVIEGRVKAAPATAPAPAPKGKAAPAPAPVAKKKTTAPTPAPAPVAKKKVVVAKKK